MTDQIFYKPENAWAADFIPYYKDGVYHLFYLLDWRNPTVTGEGTPWYKITTTDFVHFREHGEMIPRGTPDEHDNYVFTGSVIEADGKYHIFYTGHNSRFYAETNPERPGQVIMHAVSDDLEHWTKIPEDTFKALTEEYEVHDWRDPFVFYNEEDGEYQMILAARRKGPEKLRRGCTALCASKDLKKWEMREPFWEPHLYYTHECPDLFRIGEWWYHVFSEFSERHVTRYRMSRSLHGPWLAPENDMFDGRAYYAAKTASDGNRHFIFGWNPTKENNVDKGLWQWGGSLVVHEICQKEDGSLATKIPDGVDRAFTDPKPLHLHETGKTAVSGNPCIVSEISGAKILVSDEDLSGCYKYEATVTFKENTHRCGLVLNYSEEESGGYVYVFEPFKNRVMFEYWPNFPQYRYNGLTCERPLDLKPDTEYKLKILVEDTICVMYINDEVALNARMYDRCSGKPGVLVSDGEAVFSGILVSKLSK